MPSALMSGFAPKESMISAAFERAGVAKKRVVNRKMVVRRGFIDTINDTTADFEKSGRCGILFALHIKVVHRPLRRYSSGQRGQTVNLLTSVYEGSNPSRRTNKKSAQALPGRFLLVRREVKCVGHTSRGFEKVSPIVLERSELNYRQPVLRL